jgi:hypothetical protein
LRGMCVLYKPLVLDPILLFCVKLLKVLYRALHSARARTNVKVTYVRA